jgi:glycosyltransferase involved in cell wall biosynthesis
MRIAHYNTFAEGGAGVLMQRLHQALQRAGCDSQVYFRKGNPSLPATQRLEFCETWFDRQQERVWNRLGRALMRPGTPSYFGRCRQHRRTPAPCGFAPDIAHLHWVSQWLDLPSFLGTIPRHVPIVWTVHDMSPLAGGCFTDFGCEMFGNGCGICPLIKQPFNRFYAANELRRRVGALAGRKIFVVGNSTHTTQLIRKSELFREAQAVETIHPAFAAHEFAPQDKAATRQALGIPSDRFVLGFGAAALTDRNKGFDRFLAVAERVALRLGCVDALVFGDGAVPTGGRNVNIRALGRLASPAEIGQAYSAMDVFVLTSRMESFGQVAIEAQACGAPVWAFDVGGLPDAVQNGVTGKLLPFPDTTAMGESICAAKNELLAMGQRASEWARTTFSIETMAEQYLALYRRALLQP